MPEAGGRVSITHPCYDTPYRNLRDEKGVTYAIEVGEHFEIWTAMVEWLFSAAPAEVRRAAVQGATVHPDDGQWRT